MDSLKTNLKNILLCYVLSIVLFSCSKEEPKMSISPQEVYTSDLVKDYVKHLRHFDDVLVKLEQMNDVDSKSYLMGVKVLIEELKKDPNNMLKANLLAQKLGFNDSKELSIFFEQAQSKYNLVQKSMSLSKNDNFGVLVSQAVRHELNIQSQGARDALANCQLKRERCNSESRETFYGDFATYAGTGLITGATSGAAAGSAFPLVGTFYGGVLGGWLGTTGGTWLALSKFRENQYQCELDYQECMENGGN